VGSSNSSADYKSFAKSGCEEVSSLGNTAVEETSGDSAA